MAATVVFNGYIAPPPSTKSEEKKRRAAKCTHADIEIAGQIKAAVCHAFFLENPHNRQGGPIKAASERLQAVGIDLK